jgi:hypothetical protein
MFNANEYADFLDNQAKDSRAKGLFDLAREQTERANYERLGFVAHLFVFRGLSQK